MSRWSEAVGPPRRSNRRVVEATWGYSMVVTLMPAGFKGPPSRHLRQIVPELTSGTVTSPLQKLTPCRIFRQQFSTEEIWTNAYVQRAASSFRNSLGTNAHFK
eukprot:scaffold28969_cov40-Prasinocladus_malaysianus.AAC.1